MEKQPLFTKEEFRRNFRENLIESYELMPEEANAYQLHSAISQAVMSAAYKRIKASRRAHQENRRACYFSAEFLVGRMIYNNLLCLGITDTVGEVLAEFGLSLSCLEEIEDAALGNGGLGRLAACFLDSAATLNLPLDGYGIRYRYGLFKQDLVDGCQVEHADDWAAFGDAWSRRRDGDAVVVKFRDQVVNAVPYDMPIFGWGTHNVGNLRLWQAESLNPFDFSLFNQQRYDDAIREKNRAEDISRVLYPNDTTREGKILRLKQQYFFTCASVTDILRSFKRRFGAAWEKLPEMVTIQLNDTHPVIAVPELIRQLTDVEGLDFIAAFRIAQRVFNYTNHTIMSEALEKWPTDIIWDVVPDIGAILEMINNALIKELTILGVTDEGQLEQYKVISGHTVHMARLAIYMSRYVNGVARIHTEILKNTALKEWYAIYPERFQNKTNGITQRRWLALCNPEMTSLLKEELGSDAFLTNLNELKALLPKAEDPAVLDRFIAIKQEKKRQLAAFLEEHDGVIVDPNTIFDVQIKRLHEYKRQLMNAFSILYLYFGIKDGSIREYAPTTFLFGAKAAPGYARAKGIIKFINEIASLVNNDPDTNRILKVVFVKNYNVTVAQKLVSAADVSVQISTAGTEASGTGNMKLMVNGAVTLGTLDGANVEIVEEAGEENNYIFGAKVEELAQIMGSYNPHGLYESDPGIHRVVDSLVNGIFSDGGLRADNGQSVFRDLYDSLLYGVNWQRPDNYYILGDLRSLIDARLRLNGDYKDQRAFYQKCFRNMCCSGKFSSDRTIRHYAADIWKLSPLEVTW